MAPCPLSARIMMRGVLACVLLALLAGVAPARAATPSIRFEPDISTFPIGGLGGTVDIVADNIPATGLKAFQLKMNFSSSGASLPCVQFVDADVDPDLLAAWGGVANETIQVSSFTTQITWNASPVTAIQGGPTGTVRLGSLTLTGETGPQYTGCVAGTAGVITWDRTFTRFATISPFQFQGFFPLVEGIWALNNQVDVDLAIDCIQTSPAMPDFYAEGDTITLECNLLNQDFGWIPRNVGVIAVVSPDETVGPSDIRIDHENVLIPSPGQSNPVVLTGIPVFSAPGGQILYFCARADIGFNMADFRVGSLYESDETDNNFCRPVTVLDPTRDLAVQSFSVVPGSTDPNTFRPGSVFAASYTLVNYGNSSVRGHRNGIFLSDDPSMGDPNDLLVCHLTEGDFPGVQGRGGTISRVYGEQDDTSPSNDLACEIPFELTPGTWYVGLVADLDDEIAEVSEANNTASVPIQVGLPADPILRPADPAANLASHIRITGPGTTPARIIISGVRDLAAFEFTVNWSPPELAELGSTGAGFIPYFNRTFLRQNGRTANWSDCWDTNLDNATGQVTLGCASTGTEPGATSAALEWLVEIGFTALQPGTNGVITLSDVSVSDTTGQAIPVQAQPGTFEVGGFPDLQVGQVSVQNRIVPGIPFSITYWIDNMGFGESPPGTRSEAIVSVDDIIDPAAGDSIACFRNEPDSIPALTSVQRSMDDCLLLTDARPGLYNIGLRASSSPARIETLRVSPRLFALRKSGGGKVLQSLLPPEGPGGTTGKPHGSIRDFDARSIATLKSEPQNLNWLVGWSKLEKGRLLTSFTTPKRINARTEELTRVRVPGSDRAALAGADIDGDGEDELVLLERKSRRDALDFRRVDYVQKIPIFCVSAGVTEPLQGRIVAAAGISYDADPNDDEIAVLTERNGSQTLSIYDAHFDPSGPAPPPSTACTFMLGQAAGPPARVTLSLLASDPAFGGPSNRVRSLCAMDHDLDGTEEIVSLNVDKQGRQSLRVFQAPAAVDGSAILLADDPAFGGTGRRGKVSRIACTR